MELGLGGCVALITGASRGIGRATARAFVREGARVALCARTAAPLEALAAQLRAEGGEVLTAVADVGREGEVEALVNLAMARWGRLDVLVNNAGGPAPGGFEEIAEADWRAAFDLSVLGVARAVRASLPPLRASGRGRVINVLSTSVKEPQDGMLLSNSLRSAVAGLAKTLSRELGAQRITVNNVCPGHVLTGRLKEVAAYRAARGPYDAQAAVAAIPLRRLGSADEVASLITYLASSGAAYITGATIPVDGGATASLT